MPDLSKAALITIKSLVTDEGWPMASAPPSTSEPIGRYSSLYGRDSLITALQVLPELPELSTATLKKLGELQGRRTNKMAEEQEGKILHEYWAAASAWHREQGWPIGSDGSIRYFGSVDATPLYLILAAQVEYKAPSVDAALRWLCRSISRSGLLTYDGPRTGGLYHQGWRDGIWGLDGVGVRWPDGDQVEGPVAVASAQAFSYVALRLHNKV